jgi:hypothetical protein
VPRSFRVAIPVLINDEMGRARTDSRSLRLPLGKPPVVRSAGRRALSFGLPFASVGSAIAVALQPWSSALRAAIALGLLAVASFLRRALYPRRLPPHGWLVVDGRGVHRLERNRAATLADFREPIGVTVFASVDRATLRVAITTPHTARYVAAGVRGAEDAAAAHVLIERAMTAADEDLRAGAEFALSASDAERLVAELQRRSPGALDRAYLSDAAGEAIVLDRLEIRVGARRIDLTSPLEWKASLFQELGACSVSVCQATWVRQGDVELVLVASMPGDGARVREADAAVRAAGEEAVVRRTLARDVRLMQAAASEPPPRELRHAIDRTFMLAVRQALDRAPRSTRSSNPSVRMPPQPGAREKLG